jgi:hypothetical protein
MECSPPGDTGTAAMKLVYACVFALCGVALPPALACAQLPPGALLQPPCDKPALPPVRIEAAGPSISPDYAKFLGIWDGRWLNWQCATLAVLSVTADGRAQVVYALGGTYVGFMDHPYYYLPGRTVTYEARIEAGQLKFTDNNRTYPCQVSLTLRGETLVGQESLTVWPVYRPGTFTRR